MKKQTPKLILLGLFLFIFIFRLYFSLQAPVDSFSDDTSYFNLRQADYVKENLVPMKYDELSYAGRAIDNPPFFSYFLAAISYIPWGYKLILQFLVSLIVIIAYLIIKEIIPDEKSALFAAFMAGFVPLAIRETLNKVSVYCLIFPIVFFIIYCVLKLDRKLYFYLFLILSLVLAFLSPISLLIMLILWAYLILSYTEDVDLNKKEIISILLFSLIAILANIYIHFSSLTNYGISILWNNLPKALSVTSFKQVNILSLMYDLGYIPLIFGCIAVYYGIIKYKNKSTFLISSFLIVNLILLALKLINFYTALVFIGISASILSSFTLYKFFKYLQLTKISHFNKIFYFLFIGLVVLFSFYPSLNIAKTTLSDVLSSTEVESLKWIAQDSTNSSDIVLGTMYEGNVISYFSGKKNYFDTNFLLAPDPVKRLVNADIIFTTDSENTIITKMKDANIKYLLLSEKTKKIYNVNVKKFDTACFKKSMVAYKLVC